MVSPQKTRVTFEEVGRTEKCERVASADNGSDLPAMRRRLNLRHLPEQSCIDDVVGVSIDHDVTNVVRRQLFVQRRDIFLASVNIGQFGASFIRELQADGMRRPISQRLSQQNKIVWCQHNLYPFVKDYIGAS